MADGRQRSQVLLLPLSCAHTLGWGRRWLRLRPLALGLAGGSHCCRCGHARCAPRQPKSAGISSAKVMNMIQRVQTSSTGASCATHLDRAGGRGAGASLALWSSWALSAARLRLASPFAAGAAAALSAGAAAAVLAWRFASLANALWCWSRWRTGQALRKMILGNCLTRPCGFQIAKAGQERSVFCTDAAQDTELRFPSARLCLPVQVQQTLVMQKWLGLSQFCN